MDTIIFGNYSVQDLLTAAGAVVGLLILIAVIKKLFKKEKMSSHVQIVQCQSCGWKGQVSKYAGRCPSCSHPLGDQLAKR
jgi:predicted Zn-ribbon and HTH transcriptional regulator